MSIKKIAIVGPESTGKSTISPMLAEHYKTVWVPEYAREYCERLTAPCTWELEQNLLPKANKLLICDTTFITVKIWSDQMFGKAPQEVLDELSRHTYDFYLLMNIDLPWEDDPLRDFPHLREHFMDVWHQELQALGANYEVISGTNAQRFRNAVKAIDNFLKS